MGINMKNIKDLFPGLKNWCSVSLPGYDISRTVKARTWCKEHLGDSGWCFAPMGTTFLFQNPEHAVAFKLAWS